MAEASSLASKIDRNFLECGICFEPFQDPKGLPCLHAFCCKCLVDWSNACSDDQSIVSCPLCKKVYQIPEGGVEGFPAHFLVTNLRDTVDAERKTKSVTQYCEIHAGEIKRYFCENCGCSICSDCSTIELIHKGHRFTRLKEAAKRQTDSLQSLFKKGEEVEQKYEIAIQQTEQVEQHLESAANAAKNEVTHQLKDLIKRYEQDINKRKDERIRQIHVIKEKLQVELATMKSALEQGIEVFNSGSEYEITSTYSSLSAKLQQLIQTQPMAADSKLSHIKFEKPKINITSVSESFCEKQKTANIKSSVDNQVSFLVAPHSSSISATKISPQPNFAPNATMYSQPVATNHIKKKQSSVREIQRKQWKECGQIMTSLKTRGPRAIAIQPNGDIVVTSWWAHVTVFSRNGGVKCVLKDSPVNARDIAITPSNQNIIPGEKEFHIYNSQGIRLSTTPTYDVNNKPSSPTSVAVDSRGRIIVGVGICYGEQKTLCIHQPDGTRISKFSTPKSLYKIACTPDDELVISFSDNTLQVMDQSGHNARIIQSPPGIRSWEPRYVCCSKQGELFVSNLGNHKAVYRYVATGTGYNYADCISTMRGPSDIALSANEEELFVLDILITVYKSLNAK